MAQSVERPTSAQIMISEFVSSSPASGSPPSVQSLLQTLCPPLLPLPNLHAHSLSKINKHFRKKKEVKWLAQLWNDRSGIWVQAFWLQNPLHYYAVEWQNHGTVPYLYSSRGPLPTFPPLLSVQTLRLQNMSRLWYLWCLWPNLTSGRVSHCHWHPNIHMWKQKLVLRMEDLMWHEKILHIQENEEAIKSNVHSLGILRPQNTASLQMLNEHSIRNKTGLPATTIILNVVVEVIKE